MVDFGVPQWSVMGPCAFDVVIVIDDQEEEVTRIDSDIILLKFADDSKLAREVSSEDNRKKNSKMRWTNYVIGPANGACPLM